MKLPHDRMTRMIARRRDFHTYPETGWTEFRTTSKIAEILRDLGFHTLFACDFLKPGTVMGRKFNVDSEIRRAISQGANPEIIEKMKGYTGLIAELDTGRDGPMLGMRFDIDCVDTTESDNKEHFPVKNGFRSVNKGCMHACGHDGHTSLGLAIAEFIAESKSRLNGKIRLFFQPAEEGVRGGYAFASSGLCDDLDYFIALHLGLGIPTGTVCGGLKGFLCTTKIDVSFKGVGAHAGGEPNKGKNALLAAASAALNLHAIAPHRDGPTRLNVGVLNAGEGRNVVPPSATMKIETRGATDHVLAYMYERATQVLNGAATMYDCPVTIEKVGEANSTSCDDEMMSLICRAAEDVEGVTCIRHDAPMSGSDDACWLMKRVQDHGGKSTYVGLGADIAAGHHNESFDFDENALKIGYGVLTNAITELNG